MELPVLVEHANLIFKLLAELQGYGEEYEDFTQPRNRCFGLKDVKLGLSVRVLVDVVHGKDELVGLHVEAGAQVLRQRWLQGLHVPASEDLVDGAFLRNYEARPTPLQATHHGSHELSDLFCRLELKLRAWWWWCEQLQSSHQVVACVLNLLELPLAVILHYCPQGGARMFGNAQCNVCMADAIP